MAWNWMWAVGQYSQSAQVNFSPTMAVVLCSLSQADGDGLCAGGITQYRTRTQPDGPDQDHNFSKSGLTYWLPPVAYDPLMTGVTAELDVGENQQGTMSVMVWLWS
jgi:hypothetical protein